MNVPPHFQGAPPKSGSSGPIVILAVLGIVFFVLPILAVLAIYGVRQYIAGAKNAEARNSVTFMARFAAEAYEKNGRICPSASAPVPAQKAYVSARKYQSATMDWQVDAASNAGFACVGFTFDSPQYYQYDYQASATGFKAIARGDLNGDGRMSEFWVEGVVKDGKVELGPLEELDPGE